MHIRAAGERFVQSRFVRVFVIGGIGVAVQTAVFEIFGVLLSLAPLSSVAAVSAEIGVLTNFYLNNRFSFNDRQHGISLVARLARFHLVVSGSIFLQWLFVFIAEHQTSSVLLIHGAYAAGIIVGFVWNYTLYLLFVWRHEEPPTA